MRNLNARISIFLTVALLAALIAPVHAAPKPKNVVLNPATLRKMLVQNNLGIQQELKRVHMAKDAVNIARGNLLPKLDLGAAIGAATGGPGFAISAVTALLPFLVPANWANLYQNMHLLEAQKVSYKLVQLNQFASIYSLYATILADYELREVLVMQYNDLIAIRDWMIRQRHFIGNFPQSDIESADAQVKMAYAKIEAMDGLLVKERSIVREMLALNINDTITLEPMQIAESAAESMELEKAVSKAQSLSLEAAQVVYLDKAAREVKFAKIFGFMGGAPHMSLYGSEGGGVSFKDLKVTTGLSIGFDYGPNIQLASHNIELMRLRHKELKLHMAQIVEATHGAVFHVKKQITAITEAEQQLIRVYQAEFRRYTMGQSDLLHVLSAEKAIAEATAARVKAQFDLNILRITLHREFLTDQFASIPGCSIKASAIKADRSWSRSLFRSKKFSLSMDDVCQAR